MNIIQAVRDPKLFKPFFNDDLSTWKPWLTCLRAVYGLPVKSDAGRETVRQCTGRDPTKLPKGGFDEALLLVGRRAGKSRVAAVIGAYEAALAGHHTKLARGERGVVAVISRTVKQTRVVKDYLRALFETPLLAGEVVGETREGFELRTGVRIEVLPGDYRSVRGFTLLAAIVDELAFMGLDEDSRVKSDTELIAALRPALTTVGGRLIGITSPYARKGYCWTTHQRHHANDDGDILVWNAPSRTMNPTIKAKTVNRELAKDRARARAEWLAEFRDDVAEFLPRSVIEQVVVKDRFSSLVPTKDGVKHTAFADVSGGRSDDAALAIAHREGSKVVLDFVHHWKAPHDPTEVVRQMCGHLDRYGLRKVYGDAYAAEFTTSAFRSKGVGYVESDRNKSELYAELLPRICGGKEQVELLNDETLVDQLASLERRTRSGGNDVIDHPPGQKDDVANAVAGAVVTAATKKRRVGTLPRRSERPGASARFPARRTLTGIPPTFRVRQFRLY